MSADKLELNGLKGGKKQQFNRVNAALITQFAETMGWEKCKDIFNLTDSTLVNILTKNDRVPSIKKLDILELRNLDLANKIIEVAKDSLKHREEHETQRELFRAAFDIVDKIVMPIIKAAIDYTGEKEDNEESE